MSDIGGGRVGTPGIPHPPPELGGVKIEGNIVKEEIKMFV
jgi:hypothetical protein